jgi:site-specific DNA recombinase
MRVALYARVSTERQEQQGTIASQLDALRGFARDHQHEVVDDYVCLDDGYSGARLDRPGLDRLRDGAEAGAFEAALILCPDRLARKYAYQVVILEELERFGVRVIFLEQPPSDDPHARLLTQIQGAIAEYERMKITERYRRGKLFRARQGEVVCWKAPYGYRRVARRDTVPAHLEIADAEAQAVRQIFAWHVHERLSVRQIALRLTESPHLTATGRQRWGVSTVSRLLHNEAYIGRMYINRQEVIDGAPKALSARGRSKTRRTRPTSEWIPLAVPSIVDADLFRRSQAIHSENTWFSPRHLTSEHYLLRRVARCRVCDLGMSCQRLRGRDGTWHYYYDCRGHDVLRARDAIGRCPQRRLRADALDDLVWAEVRGHLESPALILKAYARLQTEPIARADERVAPDVRDLQKKLAECDREEHRLLDAYQAGLIPLDQLRRRQELLRQRRAHVASSLEAWQTERAAAVEQAQLQMTLERFIRNVNEPLATMPFERRQQLVRTVVERVMVEDGRVDIHFAIPVSDSPETPPGAGHEPVSTVFRLRSHDHGGRDPA